MRTLLIDDFRNLKADLRCIDYDTGIVALEHYGPWDMLYLDHDLGDDDIKKSGYGIACWLETNPQFRPDQIIIVSANPVGVQNIERVISKFYTKTGVIWVKNDA